MNNFKGCHAYTVMKGRVIPKFCLW